MLDEVLKFEQKKKEKEEQAKKSQQEKKEKKKKVFHVALQKHKENQKLKAPDLTSLLTHVRVGSMVLFGGSYHNGKWEYTQKLLPIVDCIHFWTVCLSVYLSISLYGSDVHHHNPHIKKFFGVIDARRNDG